MFRRLKFSTLLLQQYVNMHIIVNNIYIYSATEMEIIQYAFNKIS